MLFHIYFKDRQTYFDFILVSWSHCSFISVILSCCFFFIPVTRPSCWILISSMSFLSLATSYSFFLFSSLWAAVEPPA